MQRLRTPAKGKDGNHASATRPLPQLPLRLRSTIELTRSRRVLTHLLKSFVKKKLWRHPVSDVIYT